MPNSTTLMLSFDLTGACSRMSWQFPGFLGIFGGLGSLGSLGIAFVGTRYLPNLILLLTDTKFFHAQLHPLMLMRNICRQSSPHLLAHIWLLYPVNQAEAVDAVKTGPSFYTPTDGL